MSVKIETRDFCEENESDCSEANSESDTLQVIDEEIKDFNYIIPICIYSDNESNDSDYDISTEKESNGEPTNDFSNWTELDVKPTLENFHRNPGPNISTTNESILGVLKNFLGDDLFEFMAKETNRYHSQIAAIHKPYGSNWKEVTVSEMKKFFALIILMGQVRKDNLCDYWSTSPMIETPFFPKTMNRGRFLNIWKMWHFCNNSLINDRSDRLVKIRPVLTYVQEKFASNYTPNQQLSLHECVIPWKIGSAFHTYNPEKLKKYGILVRMICDATTGYICHLDLSSSDSNQEKSMLSVVSSFMGFNHHLYMDNYNNIKTAEALLAKNVRICGPIRSCKEIPNNLRKKLKLDEIKFLRKNDILLQVWQRKERKKVRMISTIHSAKNVSKLTKTGRKIYKPECVVEYNKYRKEVYKANSVINSCYNILGKNAKWAKKVVLYLLNCALFNAYLIHKKLNSNKITYNQFLLDVAMELVEGDYQEVEIK